MALRWLLHSASNVLGLPNNNTEDDQGDMTLPNNNTEDDQGDMTIQKSKIGGESADYMDMYPFGFQMPLHYPRYTKADYEKMEEWKVDLLLKQYGLNFKGTLDEKRAFVIGAFLWPDQF